MLCQLSGRQPRWWPAAQAETGTTNVNDRTELTSHSPPLRPSRRRRSILGGTGAAARQRSSTKNSANQPATMASLNATSV